MNSILRLQADLAVARAELDAKAAIIRAFGIYLQVEKFFGTARDGSRKDWIADARAWLERVATAGA